MRRRFGWVVAVAGLAGAASGCNPGSSSSEEKEKPFEGVELTLAIVGDPAILESVRPWRKAWEEETRGKVRVLDSPVTPDQWNGADVVIFPGDRLGEMVDGDRLSVLIDSMMRPPISADEEVAPDPLAFKDVVPAYRDLVSRYGEDRMALPIGGSALVLAYRREAMESEANRKAAAQQGISLEMPKTWEDLDALAKFFHGRDWDGDGQIDSGIAAALGPDPEGVGDAIVLARSASLGLHPDHYALLFDPDSLAPRINSPPFVEALQGVVGWSRLGPEGAAGLDAEGARKEFREGRVALLIDRAERVSRWVDPKRVQAVGVAALPGSKRVFDPDRKAWQALKTINRPSYLPMGGGWLVGLSSATSGKERIAAALDLMRKLAGPQVSHEMVASRASPMVPIRGAQLGIGLPDPQAARGVDSRAWGIAVSQTITAPRIVIGVRIPRASAYLDALGKARAAVIGGMPAEEALAATAKAWSETSASLDLARQTWHYRRSLNKLVTDFNPPPRSPAPVQAPAPAR